MDQQYCLKTWKAKSTGLMAVIENPHQQKDDQQQDQK